MVYFPIKTWLTSFRRKERGSVTVEAVMTLPVLILAIGATYEFFEVHRYTSTRDKAAYTIADMLSREMLPITATYLDNAKAVFDTITNDGGDDSLRVTIIKFDADVGEYSVKWSEVRGPSTLSKLTTAQIKDAHDTLPAMRDGGELVLVESISAYPARFDVGLTDGMQVATRIVTNPRFAPQINWDSGSS